MNTPISNGMLNPLRFGQAGELQPSQPDVQPQAQPVEPLAISDVGDTVELSTAKPAHNNVSKEDLQAQLNQKKDAQKTANPIEKTLLLEEEILLGAQIKLLEAQEEGNTSLETAMNKLVEKYQGYVEQLAAVNAFAAENPEQLEVVLAQIEKADKAKEKLKAKAEQELADIEGMQPLLEEFAKTEQAYRLIDAQTQGESIDQLSQDMQVKMLTEKAKLNLERNRLNAELGGVHELLANEAAWGLRQVIADGGSYQVMRYLEELSEKYGVNWELSGGRKKLGTGDQAVEVATQKRELELDNGLHISVEQISRTQGETPDPNMPEQLIVTIHNPVYKAKPDDTTDEFYRFTPGFGIDAGFYNAEDTVYPGLYDQMVSLFDTALPAMTYKEQKAHQLEEDLELLTNVFKDDSISAEMLQELVSVVDGLGNSFYGKEDAGRTKETVYRKNTKEALLRSGLRVEIETYYVPENEEDADLKRPVAFRLSFTRPGEQLPSSYKGLYVKDNGAFEQGEIVSQDALNSLIELGVDPIETRVSNIKIKRV